MGLGCKSMEKTVLLNRFVVWKFEICLAGIGMGLRDGFWRALGWAWEGLEKHIHQITMVVDVGAGIFECLAQLTRERSSIPRTITKQIKKPRQDLQNVMDS